jgi:ABC-type phosphate transport system substrate-binding protein
MPAGATLTTPANSTMIGSGSSTSYNMMQAMDVLFNSSPGCVQTVPFISASTPQELDYSCAGPDDIPPQPIVQQATTPENPYNDVSVQEAPLGSNYGIAQLEDQGAHGPTAVSRGVPINVADNVSYARSSLGSTSGDLKGLNFVAYAVDGVTWFHYTNVPGIGATPSANVSNLSSTQLVDIFNGTDTNWNQVGSSMSAPIVVFSAQEGSGTLSTFKDFLGFDPSSPANPVNCYTPTGGTNTCVGPAVIFENEDTEIQPAAFISAQAGFVNNNPVWGATGKASPNQIKSDAIFFFSYGKYAGQCKVKVTDCGGSPLNGAKNALGQVNGIVPNKSSILTNWPIDRYLDNVYSNGSNANIPPADAATVNYVSEIGFICNPNKGKSTPAVDPLTGVTYLNEIQSVITKSGFFPLTQTPIDEGSVTNPASDLLNGTNTQASSGTTGLYGYPRYKTYDTFASASNGDPMGFCLTTTTDGNANS